MKPDEVLPARHRGQPVVAPVETLDELRLAPRQRIAVARDASGALFVVPMVDDRRAVAGDGVAAAAVALLATRGTTRSGRFELTSWFAAPVGGEQAIAADQSNESVVVGGRAVVKWHVRGGDGPAPERLARLAEAGFGGMPRPWGSIRWHGADGAQQIATVVDYLPGAVDGWTWAVDDARAFTAGRSTADAVGAVGAGLGVLVAELHRALAAAGVTPAEPATVADWSAAARAELAEATRLVDGPEGVRLAARRDDVDAVLTLPATAAGTPMIAVHGDLHVGQLLRAGESGDCRITDFDGNPVVPVAQARLPQPAAADVAALLQSFDHVGRVVVHRTEGVDAGAVERWVSLTQRAVLDAYRGGLGPSSELLDESLIGFFRLRQVCREYLYAARHLPHWRYVPDAALPSLLARLGPRHGGRREP